MAAGSKSHITPENYLKTKFNFLSQILRNFIVWRNLTEMCSEFFLLGRGIPRPQPQMPRGPGTRPRYGVAPGRLAPHSYYNGGTRYAGYARLETTTASPASPSPRGRAKGGRGSNVLKRDKRSITIRHLRRGAFLHYPGASRPTPAGEQRRDWVLVAAVRASCPGQSTAYRAPRTAGWLPLPPCPLQRSQQLRLCNTSCTFQIARGNTK